MTLGSDLAATQLGEQPCRRGGRLVSMCPFNRANTSRVAEIFGCNLGASLVLIAHACAIPATLKVRHPPQNSGNRVPHGCIFYPANTSHDAQTTGCQPWGSLCVEGVCFTSKNHHAAPVAFETHPVADTVAIYMHLAIRRYAFETSSSFHAHLRKLQPSTLWLHQQAVYVFDFRL